MLSTAPVFNHKAVPRRVRVGLAIGISLLVTPLLPAPPTLNDPRAMSLLFQQIFIGISLGFSMRMIFTAFEMAGDLLGLQMGLAFAQFIDPPRTETARLAGDPAESAFWPPWHFSVSMAICWSSPPSSKALQLHRSVMFSPTFNPPESLHWAA